MEALEKMGKKSVENLLNSIEESKQREYSKVLYSLGIPEVGKFMANLLADESGSIDRLMEMTRDELLMINGVGEKVADSIINFFASEENLEIIEKLKGFGLNFSGEKQSKVEKNVFEGKTFLVTGKLTKFTREGDKRGDREVRRKKSICCK